MAERSNVTLSPLIKNSIVVSVKPCSTPVYCLLPLIGLNNWISTSRPLYRMKSLSFLELDQDQEKTLQANNFLQ